MKILVNDFAGHPFPLQLSRALAGAGNLVRHTYFGDNNTPKGRLKDCGSNLQILELTIGRRFEKHSLLSRRSADIAYGKALSNAICEFGPDVVLSGNTPLDAQRFALASTQKAGGKFVFWLQDLLSVGNEFVLRKRHVPFAGLAGMYYRRMERGQLEQSDAVVCIAPEFRTLLEEWRIGREKTSVIENWAALDEIRPLPKDNAWAREQQIEGKFCFIYSGTLGMKHKPELLLELAQRFNDRSDVIIVAIAEGKGMGWLRSASAQLRPGLIRLLPFQPYERLSEVLSSADVLIALLDADCGQFAVPSKTLSYLCAGRPILIAAPRENLAAQIVSRSGAGLAVPPRAEDFMDAAELLLGDAKKRMACGMRAREYAENTFDIDRITARFLAVFRDIKAETHPANTRPGQANAPSS